MSASPRRIRVFLSSPGDVAAERKHALEVLARLRDDPSFVEQVLIRDIAWDKPHAGVPLYDATRRRTQRGGSGR
jgi:hypothetical protein